MAKIEKKQSEIEKALNSAYEIYKSSIEAILESKDLNIEVFIDSVKLSKLATIEEDSDTHELSVNKDRGTFGNETHSHIRLGNVVLCNIKIIE